MKTNVLHFRNTKNGMSILLTGRLQYAQQQCGIKRNVPEYGGRLLSEHQDFDANPFKLEWHPLIPVCKDAYRSPSNSHGYAFTKLFESPKFLGLEN